MQNRIQLSFKMHELSIDRVRIRAGVDIFCLYRNLSAAVSVKKRHDSKLQRMRNKRNFENISNSIVAGVTIVLR